MRVQAEVSLYPLRTATLMDSIQAFCDALAAGGVEVCSGPMSSLVAGESGQVFAALGRAFEQVGRERDVVLVLKVSNCCPQGSAG